MAEGVRNLSGVSWIRALPSVRDLPFRPNCLPKAPPPNTVALETGFQHRGAGEGTHMKTIAFGRMGLGSGRLA